MPISRRAELLYLAWRFCRGCCEYCGVPRAAHPGDRGAERCETAWWSWNTTSSGPPSRSVDFGRFARRLLRADSRRGRSGVAWARMQREALWRSGRLLRNVSGYQERLGVRLTGGARAVMAWRLEGPPSEAGSTCRTCGGRCGPAEWMRQVKCCPDCSCNVPPGGSLVRSELLGAELLWHPDALRPASRFAVAAALDVEVPTDDGGGPGIIGYGTSVQHGTQKQPSQAQPAQKPRQRKDREIMSSVRDKHPISGGVPKVGHLPQAHETAEKTENQGTDKNEGANRVSNGASVHPANVGGCTPQMARVPGDLRSAAMALSELLAAGMADLAPLDWSGEGGDSERLTKAMGWLTFARRSVVRAESAARLALDALACPDDASLEECPGCDGWGAKGDRMTSPACSACCPGCDGWGAKGDRMTSPACSACGGAGKVHSTVFLEVKGSGVLLAAQLIEHRGDLLRLRHGPNGPDTWWDLETGRPADAGVDAALPLRWELSPDTRAELRGDFPELRHAATEVHPWLVAILRAQDVVSEWLTQGQVFRQVTTFRTRGGEWQGIAWDAGGSVFCRREHADRAEAERLAVLGCIELAALQAKGGAS